LEQVRKAVRREEMEIIALRATNEEQRREVGVNSLSTMIELTCVSQIKRLQLAAETNEKLKQKTELLAANGHLPDVKASRADTVAESPASTQEENDASTQRGVKIEEAVIEEIPKSHSSNLQVEQRRIEPVLPLYILDKIAVRKVLYFWIRLKLADCRTRSGGRLMNPCCLSRSQTIET